MKILLPVDASDCALRAVYHLIADGSSGLADLALSLLTSRVLYSSAPVLPLT